MQNILKISKNGLVLKITLGMQDILSYQTDLILSNVAIVS